MKLSITYRGPLGSCNYGCGYCPFSKRRDTADQLRRDRTALARFVDWVASQEMHELRLMFTPWGEALIRPWYQRALSALSQLPNVVRATIQTNLSCRLDWIGKTNPERLGIWATFHPTETSMERFLAKVDEVLRGNLKICVGMVAVPGQIESIQRLRHALPEQVYLWINAERGRRRPLTESEIDQLLAIDPLFRHELEVHWSRGQECLSGESAFTVDGDGTMRRCHLIDAPIGNIYHADWHEALRPRKCDRTKCDCYLGYSHLKKLDLSNISGYESFERTFAESAWMSFAG